MTDATPPSSSEGFQRYLPVPAAREAFILHVLQPSCSSLFLADTVTDPVLITPPLLPRCRARQPHDKHTEARCTKLPWPTKITSKAASAGENEGGHKPRGPAPPCSPGPAPRGPLCPRSLPVLNRSFHSGLTGLTSARGHPGSAKSRHRAVQQQAAPSPRGFKSS